MSPIWITFWMAMPLVLLAIRKQMAQTKAWQKQNTARQATRPGKSPQVRPAANPYRGR